MKLLIAIFAGLALASFPVTQAGAEGSAPAPCAGNTATDPAGDQAADPVPLLNVPEAAEATEDNTDGRALFFNFRDGVLTANLVLTNATKEVSAAALDDGMSYTIYFEEESGDFGRIQARNDGGEMSYRYSQWVPMSGVPLRSETWVETKGSMHEGPMGVISMQMPPELSKEGVKLSAIYARISVTSEREEEIATTTTDFVPDDGADSTKSYTVKACPAPAAAAAPVAAAGAPAPVQTAPTTGSQQSQPAQPATTQSKPATKARKKSCQAKARKLKGAKRARAMKKCKKAKKRRRA